MTPSVRGRRRVEVAALLVASSASTGALAGAALGLAWSAARLPGVAAVPAAAVAAAALGADALLRGTGRPRPASVRRQVPQVWSRLFDPRTVAVLYGSRLGVGPLTVLPTWTWWAAAALGASAGPAVSAAAGAAFGGVRILVVLAASATAATPAGMAGLRRAERPLAGGAAVAAALAVAAVVAGSPAA